MSAKAIACIKRATVIFIVVVITSCNKDKGSTVLQPLESMVVSGIDSVYSKITFVDTLTIRPHVHTSAVADAFDYYWMIYDQATALPSNSKIDTIAASQVLNYPVKLQAGKWQLVFCAKNKRTGYASYTMSTLLVTSKLGRAWYVVKDDNSNTDLDVYPVTNAIETNEKWENLINSVNKRQLSGKASSLAFFDTYRTSSRDDKMKVLFVWSEKDLAVLNISDGTIIRGYDGFFYNSPTVYNPLAVFSSSNNYFLINNGLLHGISGIIAGHNGIFGSKLLWDINNSPYQLAKYYLYNFYYMPVFFDQVSSSFVSAAINDVVYFTRLTDAGISGMKAENNNKYLLYMGTKSSSPRKGWAILSDKTDPRLKLLTSVAMTSFTTIALNNDTLSPKDKLYDARLYTILYEDENLLYFVRGNQVWSRNLSNGFEKLQYDGAPTEEISFIRHRKYMGKTASENVFNHNYIIVGISKGNNYIIKFFKNTAGDMAAGARFELSGSGRASDVMYLAPDLIESSTMMGY